MRFYCLLNYLLLLNFHVDMKEDFCYLIKIFLVRYFDVPIYNVNREGACKHTIIRYEFCSRCINLCTLLVYFRYKPA